MTEFDVPVRRTGFETWALALFLLIPFSYCTAFYLRYAADAWFFQDDFMLLRAYEGQLHVEQWLSPDNFGRFISRNLYWWGGWKLLGANAHGYFLFNLALMMSTSLLLFCLCLRHSPCLGLLLATAYWTAGATIGNLSWLSNSQHLLAHTLMALYFSVAERAWRQKSLPLLVMSVAVFALALSANLLSAVAMLWPLLLLMRRPWGRYATASWAMLAVQLGLALSFVITVRPEAGSPYATSWSWQVVFNNLTFYFDKPVAILGLSALLVGSAWTRLRAGDHLEALVMLAGPAFILPFLPLVHQRYLNYASFSHAFMLVGLCSWAFRIQRRWLQAMAWCVVLLALKTFAMRTHQQIDYFEHEHRGAVQRELIQSLNALIHTEAIPVGSTLCFSQRGEHHAAGEPLPGFWWGLGFGAAFSMFAGQQYNHELLSDGLECTYQFHIDGTALRLVNH